MAAPVVTIVSALLVASAEPAEPGARRATPTPAVELDAERASLSVRVPLDVLREYGYATRQP